MASLMQQSSLRSAFKAGPIKPMPGRARLVVEANKKVQKKQKVILTREVANLGVEGELRQVPVGYWRNFLLPNSYAKVATPGILEQIRKRKEDVIRAKLEEKAQAQAFANALATIGKFTLKKKAGDKDQLFASVAKAEVVAAIYQQMGRQVSEEDMSMPDIKTLGMHECTLRLHPEVVGTFQVNIQREKDVQAKGKKK